MRKRWREICNEYLKAFCERHEFQYDPDGWVGADPGTICIVGDFFFGMDDIRYDVDKQIPGDKIIEWYDYNLRVFELQQEGAKIANINYPSWCNGAPRYSEGQLKKFEKKCLKK